MSPWDGGPLGLVTALRIFVVLVVSSRTVFGWCR